MSGEVAFVKIVLCAPGLAIQVEPALRLNKHMPEITNDQVDIRLIETFGLPASGGLGIVEQLIDIDLTLATAVMGDFYNQLARLFHNRGVA